MARIRQIKPQFWTDEKIGKLPIGARLLFIGSWNLADDEGILYWNAAFIKGQLFPYDTKIKMTIIKQWMTDISSLKLVALFVDDSSETYAFIPSWQKHQRINRPHPTQHPAILAMIKASNSLNNHGTFIEHSVQGASSKEQVVSSKEQVASNGDVAAASLKDYWIMNWDGAYGLDCDGQWLKFNDKYPPDTITDGKALIDKWFANLTSKRGQKTSSAGSSDDGMAGFKNIGDDGMEGLKSI